MGHSDSGYFVLNANNGKTNFSLVGRPNGSLTWNDNNLSGAAIAAQNLAATGYIKFANGLTMQWGHTAVSAANIGVEIVFPISFISFEYVENVLPLTAGGYNNYIISVCTYKLLNEMLVEFSAVPSQQADWLTIGY